jgi:hypothetical protein
MSSPVENVVVNRENRDLRPQFSDTAAAYRRRGVQLSFILVTLMLLFWFVRLFIPGARLLALLVVLAFSIAVLFGKLTLPKLICPMCKAAADGEIIKFCSECGSDKLQRKGEDKYFLPWPRCHACGKDLSRSTKGNRRLYRIRFCTRCGAFLDERGL